MEFYSKYPIANFMDPKFYIYILLLIYPCYFYDAFQSKLQTSVYFPQILQHAFK